MKDNPIKLVQKAGTPTLLDTSKANELIGIVNAIGTMLVVPQGTGKFRVEGDTAILDLSGSNSNATLGAQMAALQDKLGQLINSISGGSLDVICDPNTANINASLNFPNFPNANF